MGRRPGPLNPEATKQAILLAATRHFAERGFSATSLPQIAKDVGISAPTLLYHFGSKDNLLEEVLRHAWAEVRADLRHRLTAVTHPAEAIAAAYASLFTAESSTGSLHAQISAAVLGERGVGKAAIADTLLPLLDDVVEAMVHADVDPVGPPERVRAMLVFLLVAHASGYLLEDRVPGEVAAMRENEVGFALALLASLQSRSLT